MSAKALPAKAPAADVVVPKMGIPRLLFTFIACAGIVIHHLLSPTPLALTKYSNLVVFGASYNDNGHARSAVNQGSLKYSQFEGRYQNGPVSTEYMASSVEEECKGETRLQPQTGVNYTNYAYGGSTADNTITPSAVQPSGNFLPATKDQVIQYFDDLSTKTETLGESRVLLYINTGINQITRVWLNAIAEKLTEDAIDEASRLVTANVKAVADQMRSITTNDVISSHKPGYDLLIVGIPPLETTPYHSILAENDKEKLDLLDFLCLQYNTELLVFAAALKQEMAKSKLGKNMNVFSYDMAKLWRRIYSAPESYNISSSLVNSPCYNSVTGAVCDNPTQRIYFDGLHPVTSIQRLLAIDLVKTVRGRM